MKSSPNSPIHVVVIGAGRAAVSCAAELLDDAAAPACNVTLISDEAGIPYERPQVSKSMLASAAGHDAWPIPGAATVVEHDRCRVVHGRVTSIDEQTRTVSLADGRSVPSDHVVVATGVAPRVLEGLAGQKGVHTLRSSRDAEYLRQDASRAGRIVIVGGGFIGMEAASSLVDSGVDVTVVEPARLPMERAVGNGIARHLADLARRAGIDLRLQTSIDAVRRNSRSGMRELDLSDGSTIAAPVVLMSVGTIPVLPDIPHVARAGDGAITTDSFGRSSVPRVWACGDVAAWWWPRIRRHERVEHWGMAAAQGRAVALGIRGRPDSPADEALFWSDQFGVRLQRLARVGTPSADHAVRSNDGSVVSWVHDDDGTPLGVTAINAPREIGKMRRVMRQSIPPAGLAAESSVA